MMRGTMILLQLVVSHLMTRRKKTQNSRHGDADLTESFSKLVNAALQSHKKQEKNKIINDVKEDVVKLIRSRFGSGGGITAASPKSGGIKKHHHNEDKDEDDDHLQQEQHSGDERQKKYMRRCKKAYHTNGGSKEKFGSKEHKATVSWYISKLNEVNDAGMTRIPHIDKMLGIDSISSESLWGVSKIVMKALRSR